MLIDRGGSAVPGWMNTAKKAPYYVFIGSPLATCTDLTVTIAHRLTDWTTNFAELM